MMIPRGKITNIPTSCEVDPDFDSQTYGETHRNECGRDDSSPVTLPMGHPMATKEVVRRTDGQGGAFQNRTAATMTPTVPTQNAISTNEDIQSQRRDNRNAALINPTWLYVCGKLPLCSNESGRMSSE